MNRAQLLAALKNADAAASAGDQEAAADARKLADMLRSLPAEKAAPERDQFHMVKPEARARVAAAQGQRVLPMSPLGPGNERYAPKPPPAQNDPLAASPETAAANIDAQQRARGLVPYTHAATGETYWRPDPARQIADANAQFRARETAKAANAQAQAELEAWRKGNFLGVPNTARESVSNAVKGGLATIENGVFDTVDAGIDLVDPQRNLSRFVSETVTPATEAAGRRIGEIIDGPSGRFAGMAGPLMGSIAGGVSEWGATMARDPQQGLTEAVDMLEPTHQLARGSNTAGSAINAAAIGDGEKARQLMLEATPDLLAGGLGVLPVGSFTVNAMRNAAMAPTREMAEQLARIPARNAQGAPMPVVRGGGGAPPPPPGATPPAVSPARSRAEQRADDIFIRKLQADGLTIDDVRKVQASLARRGDSGVYETSGELAALSGKSSGANLRGLQMAGGAAPGPLQEALISRVNENATKLPDRLSRAATRATGQNADNAVATLDDLDARLRTEATPAYDEAYATPPDPVVFQNEILPVLNTPSGQEAIKAARNNLAAKAAELQGRAARGASDQAMREWNRAQDAVASIDAYLADPVRGTAIPTTMALDYTKRAFDDVIAKAGFGSDTARIVGGTKRSFADSVSQATGGKYGNALGVYSDVKSLEDAFETGLKALSQKTWQLQRDMAKGRNGTPYSGGEIEAIAMGVARSIEDMIEAGDNRALTTLTKDKALKNIATALGSEEAAAKFEQSIRRLAANREWGRRVAGGSDTAMRQAAIRDAGMEGEDAVTRVLDRVETSGNQISLPGIVNDIAVKPLARTAKSIYQHLRYPGVYDEEVNRALVPLLSTPMTKGNLDEVIRRVEARLAEKGKTQASKVATASSAKATSGKTTTTPASATVTGVVSGGIGGALLPAETEEDQFVNALFGAAVVGGGAGGVAQLAKGRGSPKPPPAPRGAGRRNPPPAPRTPPGAPPVQSGFGGGRKLPMDEPGPMFYSALSRAVEKSPTTKAPASQWKATIANSPGVKAEEIEWTGINDWLDMQTGPVTKQQVAEYLDGNGVKIEETVKGAAPSRPPEVQRQLEEMATRLNRLQTEWSNAWDKPNRAELEKAFNDLALEKHNLEAKYTVKADAAKWDTYTLPGGENYRELLIRMPVAKEHAFDPSKVKFNKKQSSATQGGVQVSYDGKDLGTFDLFTRDESGPRGAFGQSVGQQRPRTDDEIIEIARKYYEQGNSQMNIKPLREGTYKSSHWDEPNVLAHIRFKERTSADGKRVLAIEEIQSDWHQAGRDKGYRNTKAEAEFDAYSKELAAKYDLNPQQNLAMYGSYKKMDPAEVARYEQLQKAVNFNNGSSVPDAPFKNNAWAALSLKRMIRWAAENDFDEIAWVPGQVPVERFNIATKVGMLSAMKRGDGRYLVYVEGKNGRGAFSNRNGNGWSDASQKEMNADELRELVGADVANQLIKGADAKAQSLTSFSNTKEPDWFDLKPKDMEIGGEGMRAFYDKILVNEANKLGRKYGAQVGKTEVGRGRTPREKFSTELARRGFKEDEAPPVTMHSLPITPELKKQALGGQALMSFARTGANATGLGGAGGAVAGAAFAPDANGDGVIDAQERMAGGMGGLVTGLVGGAGANRLLGPRRGVSKAGPQKPPAQSGFGGGKPPPGSPPKAKPKASRTIMGSAVGRAATGGVVGGAVGALAGEAGAQEDLTSKISETERIIAEIKKAMADLDKITDPFEKQRFLKDQGYYAGRIDGNIAGKTTEGMVAWKAKKEADLKKAEDERKDLVRRDALQSNRPDPLMMALREYGPAVFGIGALFGMKYMRGGAAKASIKTAEAASNKLNKLITKGPVTGALNKRDENRFANLNKLWQKGGASKDELPFKQDSAGKYKPNAKAKLPEELFADSGVWQTVTKYVKGKDVAIILGGGLDVAIAQPFIDKANENLKKAEAAWNDTPSDETAKALEDAKNEVAAYTLLQRIGMGVAGGRILGTFGGAYAKPMPNIPAAASEQAKLKQFIASQKPPPKPRAKAKPPVPKPKPKPRPKPPAPPVAPPTSQLPLPLKGGGKKKP